MVQVFISHSSVDAALAAGIVRLIEKALRLEAAAIRCTSVDGYGLPPGASTDDTLKREIFDATTFVALITESSLRSTYVLFELGARWGAGRHLVPMSAGLNSNQLGGPLRGLNVLDAANDSHLHALVESIGAVLGRQSQPASVLTAEIRTILQLAGTAPEKAVWRPVRRKQRRTSENTNDIETKIRQICAPLARGYDDFHVEPHIPSGALSALRRNVYAGPDPILVAIDTTAKDTAESAVILTRRGISWRNPGSDRTNAVTWDRLAVTRIRADNEQREVILGAEGIVDLGESWVEASNLSRVLRQIAARDGSA